MTMERAEAELSARQIGTESRVLPVDSDPKALSEYVENARLRGIRVLIAGAGPARAAARGDHRAHAAAGDRRAAHQRRAHAPRVRSIRCLSSSHRPTRATRSPGSALDDAVNAAVLAARILGA